MASIKLAIPQSRKSVSGEIPIRILLSHKHKSLYISTSFTLNDTREFVCGNIVGRPDASAMNVKLRNRLNDIQAILDNLPTDVMTCGQIKEAIKNAHLDNNTISSYGDKFVKNLLQDKRESYAINLKHSVKLFVSCLGGDVALRAIDQMAIVRYEQFLRAGGNTDTTIAIRMSHIKALLNRAVNNGVVHYQIFPFAGYRMPKTAVRDLAISLDEFKALRDFDIPHYLGRRFSIARDMFLLSFYLGGLNLIDISKARFDSSFITFVRSKTAHRRTVPNETSITIPIEAQDIINKYVKNGKIELGYHFSEYKYLRGMITRTLNELGVMLKFERRLVFYAARKTFCQFGFELGVPLYILEYAVGQTIKEANNRPIFSYIKIMRPQADEAIRKIIDYTK